MMYLIIGGAYQGKHDYVRQQYPDCTEKLVDNLHLWVRGQLAVGNDPLELLRTNLADYRDKIIIVQDISCGLVPMDAGERQWREAVGRCTALLATHADSVIRLFCGLPTRLK